MSVKNAEKTQIGTPFEKGNPGRAKGSTNKFTNLKQAFLDVFEKIEEESKKNSEIKSFYQWVLKNDRNRGMFYQLISKMLPSNVAMEGDMRVIINRIITEQKPDE